MSQRMAGSILLMAVMILTAVSFGGSVIAFLDVPSFVLVMGMIVAGTVMSYSLSDIGDAFRCAALGSDEESRAVRGHEIFSRMADIAVAAGLMGTVIGLVQMLQNMSDPTAIGPAMAVALLTLLYGVVLGEMVCRGLAMSCLRVPPEGPQVAPRRGAISIYALIGSLFILLFTFSVMLLAMSGWDHEHDKSADEDSPHIPVEHGI